MMKAVATLKASVNAMVETSLNIPVRKSWDKAIDDFKIFESSPDGSIARVAYNFKSPAPFVTSDRDFYTLRFIKRDFP